MSKTPKLDLIGTADLCELAGIDRSTLSRHVAFGKIRPAMRVGHGRNAAMLFTWKDAAAYIAALKTEQQSA